LTTRPWDYSLRYIFEFKNLYKEEIINLKMGEEGSFRDDNEYFELVSDIVDACGHLQRLSSGRDLLLKYVQGTTKPLPGNGVRVEAMIDLNSFLRDYGISEKSLPKPIDYFALKRFYEKINARISFREREELDFSISAGVSYLEYLCSKTGTSSEILKFLDFSSSPPKISSLFREWAEIGTSELEDYCEEYGESVNNALVQFFQEELFRDIDRVEKKYFIGEETPIDEEDL
jgi:hypothetical protein